MFIASTGLCVRHSLTLCVTGKHNLVDAFSRATKLVSKSCLLNALSGKLPRFHNTKNQRFLQMYATPIKRHFVLPRVCFGKKRLLGCHS